MASGSFHVSTNYHAHASADCSWSSQHYFGNLCLVTVVLKVTTYDNDFNYSGVGTITVSNTESSPSVSGAISSAGTSYGMTICQNSFAIPYDDLGKAHTNISINVALTASAKRISSMVYDVVGSGSSGSIQVGSISKYATITSAPNFGDEDNPTITISNSWGATNLKAAISLDGSTDDIKYRSVSSGSYTFNLTDEERNLLIDSITNGYNRNIRFWLRSTLGGSSTSKHSVEKVFSLTEYEPVLNPVVVDMNDKTTALTGDYNKFIKGYSRAACQTNAEARKHATITEYYFSHNGIERKELKDLASFIEVEIPLFVFGATDSRGNSARQEVNVDIIDYFKPWCEIDAEYTLTTETTMDAKMIITGQGWNKNFGAQENRFKLEWRLTDADGYWSDWQDVSEDVGFVFDENKPNEFKYEVEIRGFRYDVAYSFQARITDLLDSYTCSPFKKKLLPVFDWGENDFNFNVPIQMNEETVLRHNKDANNTVLSASGGFIYMRPGGTNSTSGEVKITPQGNIELTGDILINGKSLKSLLGI